MQNGHWENLLKGKEKPCSASLILYRCCIMQKQYMHFRNLVEKKLTGCEHVVGACRAQAAVIL